MTVSIDTFNASFIHYLPGVIDLIKEESMAESYTEGQVKNWQGTQLQKSVKVAQSDAIAFVEDGGAIPPSSQVRYLPATATRRFVSAKIGLTQGQLDNARSTEYAAIEAIRSEYDSIVDGITSFMNFFWTRDGTGIMCDLGTVATCAALGNLDVTDGRGLWVGGHYSVVSAAAHQTVLDTFQVGAKQRAWDAVAGECIINPVGAVAGTATGDHVVWGTGPFRSSNTTVAGIGRALTGLMAGIDDAAVAFQGIPAAITAYTSAVHDNAGVLRPLTPALIRMALGSLVQEGGKLGKLVALGSPWLVGEFDEMYEANIQVTPDTTVNGMAAPTFQCSYGSITLVHDRASPYHTLFIFDPAEITLAVQAELQPRTTSLSESGSAEGGIFMKDPGNLSYSADFYRTCELFYENRRRMCRIDDLEEDIGSAF